MSQCWIRLMYGSEAEQRSLGALIPPAPPAVQRACTQESGGGDHAKDAPIATLPALNWSHLHQPSIQYSVILHYQHNHHTRAELMLSGETIKYFREIFLMKIVFVKLS